jgi:hypothetical protein
MIIKDGISISDTKVELIQDWKSFTIKNDIQSFLGFTNFYQWFIINFLKVINLLTDLTKEKIKLKGFT